MRDRLPLEYQRRARAVTEARRTARLTHPAGCECPFCLTYEQARARIAERAAARRPAPTEAPF